MEPWRRLDEASPDEARALLTACCGARRWVDRMLARRPFRSREALLAAAREEWFALSRADWLEAFAQHPRIGDREALRRRFAATRHHTEQEQAGVDGASDAVISALAEGNLAYEARFGHIFLVCATGKTASEMLALLEQRLRNDPDTEMCIAAGEQAQITEIRLMRMH